MKLDLNQITTRLPDQRWFGDKTRSIQGVGLLDSAVLEEGEEDLVLALLRVRFTDGGSSTYQMPVLVDSQGNARDVMEDPQRLRVIGSLMARPRPVKGDHGTFHLSGPGLDPSAPPGDGHIQALAAEQSNTSVVFDDEVILKFFRKIEAGANPDLELGRLLTNEGFLHVPSQVGEIFYETETDSGLLSYDLAIAQQFVPGGAEGWRFALDHLGALYDEIHEADVAEDRRALTEERASELLGAIDQLGEVTGALHVLLARTDLDPDLIPEPVEDPDIKEWAHGTIGRLRELAQQEPQIAKIAPLIEERIDGLSGIEQGGQRTRVHGDYHLGQVLWAARRWMILDFEGEPARTLPERRAKSSPLKDVAGMLRSFSYAAHVSLFERAEPDSDEWARLEPWAATWESIARERFLTAYLTRSHEGDFLPDERHDIAALLDYFEIDKALYEVSYEMGHRPDWLRIPLKGIKAVLGRRLDP
jgi:trehalose synthase-fused probable maltokinase